MQLFKIIDYLFAATYYLVWGMAICGIPLSIALIFYNIDLGLKASALFFACLLLSVALVLLLFPKKWVNLSRLKSTRLSLGIVLLVASFIIAAITCVFEIPTFRVFFLN